MYLILKSIEIEPDIGFEKYTQLAQLSTGKEALSNFQQAINILKNEMNQSKIKGENSSLLKRNLISTWIAISELYMTDLCFELNAESECEHALQEALLINSSCWETYQALASLRISQQRLDEANQYLIDSFQLWKDLDVEDDDYPSYDARVALVQLLIEVESCSDLSGQVMDRLMEEDDADIQVWYLNAIIDVKDQDWISAKESLEMAQKLSKANPTINQFDEAIADLMKQVEKEIQSQDQVQVEQDQDQKEEGDNNMEVERE